MFCAKDKNFYESQNMQRREKMHGKNFDDDPYT